MSKKKKIIFWTIGVIVVLVVLYLASVFFLCPKFSSMAQDQNYRSCSQDSDCVILRSDEGGCINKNNWVRLASYLCTPCSIFNRCLYPTSCTCNNGQCQAHFDNNYQSYDQQQEGVILTTDKTEYEKGKEVNVTITNNLKESIWYPFGDYTNNFALFGYNSSGWSQVPVLPFILPPERWSDPEIIELKSGELGILEHNPLGWVSESSLIFDKYKLRFYYKLSKDSEESVSADSNEFIIK